MKHNSPIPTIAVIAELIGGYFLFLGIGWLIAGDILMGILLLVGYWIFAAIVGFIVTLSLGCLWPVAFGLYIAIPIISAVRVYRFATANPW